MVRASKAPTAAGRQDRRRDRVAAYADVRHTVARARGARRSQKQGPRGGIAFAWGHGMNRTALVLAFGFTLAAIACGGSDDTSTDATGANGAGAAGTAGAGGGGTAGSGGAGNAGTGGTAGGGGAMAGSGGTTAGNGGTGGSVGGAGSGGAQACPTTPPSQGAACTQSCSYPTTLCGSCSTKTVCSCTAAGTLACQTDPSDTCYCACTGGCGGPKGGSGGSPQGGSGGAPPAGGSGGAPPVDCPPAGSSCVATLECAKSGTVTICDGGVAWQGVDTGAKSDAACDPTGTWSLTYGDVQVPPGFCTQPGKPPTLVVKKAPSGKLLATFGGSGSSVSIDATACTMKASQSSTATNPSESWTESTTATLKVAGDTATGTYTLANTGFCNASVSGPLDAVRK